MRRALLLCMFLVVVSYGDTTTLAIDTTKVDSFSILEDTVEKKSISEQRKRRYKVVSAVMMMLFVGIAMGTSQSNNPK